MTENQYNLTSFARQEIAPLVYVRTTRVNDGLDDTGWVLRNDLVATQLRLRANVNGPQAHLRYHRQRGEQQLGFETLAGRFGIDDQVKIVLPPYDDQGLDQGVDAEAGQTIFTGILSRHQIDVAADAQSDAETLRYVADPLFILDDVAYDHTVRGRWGYNSGLRVIESPSLPAIFNQSGRPNCSADTLRFGGVLTAPLWTHDDDPEGRHWTVRRALAATIGAWLLGVGAMPRHTAVDPTLMAALEEGATVPDSLAGLDAQLPEVNIHGLGVLSAVEAICRAAGFMMAIEPSADYGTTLGPDRLWVLRVWRRGRGRAAYLDMAKRGTTFATATDRYQQSNVDKLTLLRDVAESNNSITAVARQVIELRVELKPLWSPDQVYAGDATDQTYLDRHVSGGVEFDTYGHVGRMWGLDCVGAFTGYTSGAYKHEVGGFNWPNELGLGDDANAIVQYRAGLGVTDTIIWSKRVRTPLPMISPAARLMGQEYLLEVSEDSGSTWQPLDLAFVTLSERFFGIQFRGVEDLAKYNILTQQTGRAAQVEAESWWGLIAESKLRVRLTCSIEADHASIAFAGRQSTAGSAYDRYQLVITDMVEGWISPSSPLNTSADWLRVAVNQTASIASPTTPILDVARRRRDDLEDLRLSGAAYLPVLDLTRYRLGDRLLAVRGRDYSLAQNGGSSQRFVNVVGITAMLEGVNQSVRLNLEDMAMTGGL